MITENLSTLKIHKLTQAQYDRELANGTLDDNALYLTPDEEVDLSGYATKDDLNAKSDNGHNHVVDDITDLQVELDELLETSKSYTDSQTENVVTFTHLTGHNTSTSAHNDIRLLITDLTTRLNTLADSDDTTLDQISEIVAYIKSNKELIDAITTSKVSVSDIIDNLTTNVTNKPLSAAQGVALKSLIDSLQEKVDGKADSSHTHDDRYYTETEIDTKVDTINTSITNIINGTTAVDTAKYATNAQGAVTAAKATKDGNGNVITETYETKTDATAKLNEAKEYTDTEISTHTHANYMTNTNPVGTGSFSMNRFSGYTVGDYSHAVGYNTTASGISSHAEGTETTASATASHAEGYKTRASGVASHAEGGNVDADGTEIESRTITIGDSTITIESSIATGHASHAEGVQTYATGHASHAEGHATTTSGNSSHAEGIETTASATASHAEGGYTTASASGSHAEGSHTTASGDYSHAEGLSTHASAVASHAEGDGTIASGDVSHAEGCQSLASTYGSHAEGGFTTVTTNTDTEVKTDGTLTAGTYGHAEGYGTVSCGITSHAEGYATKASGEASHTEGYATSSSGKGSHAEGCFTTASGEASHAAGYFTTALDNQYVIGHYNSSGTAGSTTGTTGDVFIIGKGTASSKSNAMRVTYAGKIFAAQTTITTGADYAEFFEWQDSNPNREDRRGYFVTLDGENIKIAEPDDYILGIVSGMPCVVGNGDEDWRGRYILDDFGAFITEEFEYEEETIDNETGETKVVIKTGTRYKENPDYDPSLPYIQREDRPEWDAVGMMGVLSVRDDGTCQVNGFCKVAEGGIATASESGYRVIKRINENIVKVVFK